MSKCSTFVLSNGKVNDDNNKNEYNDNDNNNNKEYK